MFDRNIRESLELLKEDVIESLDRPLTALEQQMLEGFITDIAIMIDQWRLNPTVNPVDPETQL